MKDIRKQLGKLLYDSKFWDSYCEYAETETEDAALTKKYISARKEIFILSNFLGVLGYLDDPFSHSEEFQKQLELCDDDLSVTLLTGWHLLENGYDGDEDYDYNIVYDVSGNKINNEENINLS